MRFQGPKTNTRRKLYPRTRCLQFIPLPRGEEICRDGVILDFDDSFEELEGKGSDLFDILGYEVDFEYESAEEYWGVFSQRLRESLLSVHYDTQGNCLEQHFGSINRGVLPAENYPSYEDRFEIYKLLCKMLRPETTYVSEAFDGQRIPSLVELTAIAALSVVGESIMDDIDCKSPKWLEFAGKHRDRIEDLLINSSFYSRSILRDPIDIPHFRESPEGNSRNELYAVIEAIDHESFTEEAFLAMNHEMEDVFTVRL